MRPMRPSNAASGGAVGTWVGVSINHFGQRKELLEDIEVMWAHTLKFGLGELAEQPVHLFGAAIVCAVARAPTAHLQVV